MKHELIQEWNRFATSAKGRPYVLDKDKNIILENKDMYSNYNYDSYIQKDVLWGKNDKTFHIGLYPIPYCGALDKAKVFLLQLNPGLSHGDYFAEYQCKKMGFRDAQILTLKQDNMDNDFPFIYLDPKYCWHPGFSYWQGRLQDVIVEIKDRMHISYHDAASHVSKYTALLELIPYHSKVFGAGRLINKLRSVELIRLYVNNVLLSKAEKSQIKIIIMRRHKEWNLPALNKKQKKNIIIYEGNECRAAHLTKKAKNAIYDVLI